MKIILQNQGKMAFDASKMSDEDIQERGIDEEFALDDTAFDVPGWISVEVGGVSVAEVHITDLYPAVVAYQKRFERHDPELKS